MIEKGPKTGQVLHVWERFRFRFHPQTSYRSRLTLAGIGLGALALTAYLDASSTQVSSVNPAITRPSTRVIKYKAQFRQKTGEAYFIDWPVAKGEYIPSEDDPFLRPVGGVGIAGQENPPLGADRDSRSIAVASQRLEGQQVPDLPTDRVSVEDVKKFLEHTGVKFEHLQVWEKPSYQAIVKKPLLLHSFPDRNRNDFPRLGQEKSVVVIRPDDQFEIIFGKYTGTFLVYVINPVKEKIEEWMFVLPAQGEQIVLTQSSKKDPIIIDQPFAILLYDKTPGDKPEAYVLELKGPD